MEWLDEYANREPRLEIRSHMRSMRKRTSLSDVNLAGSGKLRHHSCLNILCYYDPAGWYSRICHSPYVINKRWLVITICWRAMSCLLFCPQFVGVWLGLSGGKSPEEVGSFRSLSLPSVMLCIVRIKDVRIWLGVVVERTLLTAFRASALSTGCECLNWVAWLGQDNLTGLSRIVVLSTVCECLIWGAASGKILLTRLPCVIFMSELVSVWLGLGSAKIWIGMLMCHRLLRSKFLNGHG